MKRPLIVANWKLYVQGLDEARASAKTLARKAKTIAADIVVCPPSPFIYEVRKALGRTGLAGAQAVSRFVDEKRTGEVSARVAASAGARYVIVGHSERRAMGQSAEDIRAEVEAALNAKLLPVLCIGEDERDGVGSHFAAIEAQLRSSLPKLSPKDAKLLVIAYEPVWAIGKTAQDAMTPDNLEETALYIRKVLAEELGRAQALKTPILYGGSVEPDNAEYLMHAGVSGFLVGHASADPKSLIAIAKAATNGIKKR
jgi:triosephosphate isomerase (TIM)